MTDPTQLGALFKQAADIAAQVPEPLREIAFQRALDALIGVAATPARDLSRGGSGADRETKTPPRARDQHSADVTVLLETLDRTELASLLRGRKVLDRALLLLRAAQHHQIEALTPADIATVLAKKFREPTNANAVRMALDRSPSYTDRRPNAGSYVYSLMAPGEEYLDSLESSPAPPLKKAGHRTAKRVKGQKIGAPRGAKVPAAREVGGTRGAEPARAKRSGPSGRPGPKAVVEALIVEGFFSSPRTMTEILTHLQEQKTYSYKTSDMTATLQRLVRQDRLSRSRNDEAQFEYKAK